MALVHCLHAYSRGNLVGVQASQRDWSPFLAHFTTWSAMKSIRSIIADRHGPKEVARLLEDADAVSWSTMQAILESSKLIASSPSPNDHLPPCVCLSECTLPGLISHCERYGRFGLVFGKEAIYRAGGRPCLYVAEDEYEELARLGRGEPVESPRGRLFALANVYVPPRGRTNKIQDYTHEREWRIFRDADFESTPIVALLSPSRYAGPLSSLAPGLPVIPIDTLVDWGA